MMRLARPTSRQGFYPEKLHRRDGLQDDAPNRGTTLPDAVVIASGRLSPGESRPSCVPTSRQSTVAFPGPALLPSLPAPRQSCIITLPPRSHPPLPSSRPPAQAAASRISMAPSRRPRACHPGHSTTPLRRSMPSSTPPCAAAARFASLLPPRLHHARPRPTPPAACSDVGRRRTTASTPRTWPLMYTRRAALADASAPRRPSRPHPLVRQVTSG